MICYIMCILLWIAYLWLDCMVVAYAFEPRRDSVRQAGIILGLMAAQLPAAALKFLFNDNVLVRYGAMIAVGIVTVAYAAVFLKGTIGQKVLFMLCEYRYFEQVYGAKATIVLLYTDNGIVVIGSIDSDSHIFSDFSGRMEENCRKRIL